MLLINTGRVECCMISSHVSRGKDRPEGENIDWNKGQNIIFRDIFLKAFLSPTGSNHRRVWFRPLFRSSATLPLSLCPHISPRSLFISPYLSACGSPATESDRKEKSAEDTNRTFLFFFFHRQIFPFWCFGLQTSGHSNVGYQRKNLSGKIQNSCLNSLFMTYCAFWRLFLNVPWDMRTTST